MKTEIPTNSNHSQLARRLRLANIVLCILVITYFLSFVGVMNVKWPLPWTYVVWREFLQVLIIYPQIIVLLLLLLWETMSKQSARRHGFLLIVVISVSAAGYWWSMGVIGAMSRKTY